MSFDHSSWWYGGDHYDRQTNDRLDELAAAQARARSRLAEQMKAQTRNLQAQLDRLTEAFVAFVEYEDIRGELNQHVDVAAVRRYAREVVATTVMTGGNGLAALGAPADVPGYWLAAAARGIALAVTGPATGSDDALAEAVRRDPVRTAFYLVLLDALRREPRWGTPHLAATLPQATEVTGSQRAVWTAIADGRLGDEARRQLVDALRRVVGTPRPDVLGPLVDPAVTRSSHPIEQAVQRLARLRELVTGTAPAPAPPQGRRGPKIAADEEHSSEPSATEDPIADCLRSLVDQGAPSEADVLDRMASARRRMGFVNGTPDGDHWDTPAGAVLDLLLADLSEPGAGGSGRHRVAVDVLAPLLRAAADAFEQDAVTPPPPERTIHAAREVIAVTATGATDNDWPDRVAASICARAPQAVWRHPASYATAGLAVVAVVLALVVAPVFWVLAFGLGTAAGVLLVQHLSAARQLRAAIDGTISRGTRDIEVAVADIASDRELAAASQGVASGHRTAIHAALA